ncbi:MAG: zinc-binding alcohol dehydrogenase [Clostridia bacterium]|nr:zinc-binding alcohol dehydrogenase [Clostridia bacterium]
MTNRHITFVAAGIAELQTGEVSMPRTGEVLVKTVCSTVSSGTERANLSGNPNIGIGKELPDMTKYFPRRLGYSSAGIVEAVGEGVTSVKPGDRVAVSWGTHTLYQTRDENNVYCLPDDVSFQDAALGLIGTFPLAAIRKTRLEIGESAIVMGQGVLGQVAVQLLRIAGAAPIIAVDPSPDKRERALTLGADYALDPFTPDFVNTVHRLTGGIKAAIEVTGNGHALDQVLDCMARFGRVALLGCTRSSDFTIDYYRKVHGPGITLIGAHTLARPDKESSAGWWTTRDDMMALLKLTSLGRLKMADLVEEVHSPADCGAVYARLMQEMVFPVVQFDWTKLD